MSGSTPNQHTYSDAERVGPWQERLQAHCASHGMRPPIYSIASDRRGGRTAWSCSVEVQGHTYPARYWYDGNWVGNAKEDAAQVALERFEAATQAPTAQQNQQPSHGGSSQQQQQQQGQQWHGYTRGL